QELSGWRASLSSWGLVDVPIRFEQAVVESEKIEKLSISEEEMEDIMHAARLINSHLLEDLDDIPLIYVTIINNAFAQITENWMCNVQPFETILDRTLIIAGSAQICDKIIEKYSEVACVPLSLPSSYNGNFEEKPEHRRLFTAFRLKVMENLVQNGLNFVFFDTDSIWLRDPSELFTNVTQIQNVDLVVGSSLNEVDRPFSSDPLLIIANERTESFISESRRLIE
ncbi:hypothetical protein PFISCL1PPCAC_4104, partial [Pristionchus fissidentatus]